jgi:hypothetical protein
MDVAHSVPKESLSAKLHQYDGHSVVLNDSLIVDYRHQDGGSMILLAHALLAMSSIVAGSLALKFRKFSTRHTSMGELYHWLMLATCVTALILSYTRGRATVFTYLTPPSYAFAVLGYLMAKYRPAHWLAWHIAGQGGSYTALITGVLFQVVPRFWRSGSIVFGASVDFWVILVTPIVIGTVIIVRTERKWKPVSLELNQAKSMSSASSTLSM